MFGAAFEGEPSIAARIRASCAPRWRTTSTAATWTTMSAHAAEPQRPTAGARRRNGRHPAAGWTRELPRPFAFDVPRLFRVVGAPSHDHRMVVGLVVLTVLVVVAAPSATASVLHVSLVHSSLVNPLRDGYTLKVTDDEFKIFNLYSNFQPIIKNFAASFSKWGVILREYANLESILNTMFDTDNSTKGRQIHTNVKRNRQRTHIADIVHIFFIAEYPNPIAQGTMEYRSKHALSSRPFTIQF